MSTQHRAGRRRGRGTPSPLAVYRVVVFSLILGPTLAYCLAFPRMPWQWPALGIAAGATVLMVWREPQPRTPRPAADRIADAVAPVLAELLGDDRPTSPLGPLVDRGTVPDLAEALRLLAVTDLEHPRVVGIPTPFNFEAATWWLDELADWMRVHGVTTADILRDVRAAHDRTVAMVADIGGQVG